MTLDELLYLYTINTLQTNTGINAAGERARRSPATSRTEWYDTI